jgi:hypothetical protein
MLTKDSIYAIQKRSEKTLFTNLPRTDDEIREVGVLMRKRCEEMKVEKERNIE